MALVEIVVKVVAKLMAEVKVTMEVIVGSVEVEIGKKVCRCHTIKTDYRQVKIIKQLLHFHSIYRVTDHPSSTIGVTSFPNSIIKVNKMYCNCVIKYYP